MNGRIERRWSYQGVTCFFNDTATTEIYTLSLHDALPISGRQARAGSRPRRRLRAGRALRKRRAGGQGQGRAFSDRKSTRLNSSHANISYAVFCLKKKNHLALSFAFFSILDYLHDSSLLFQ